MSSYTGPRGLFRQIEIMRHVRQLPRDWQVLEVGAGKLGLTLELARHFDHVTAIDLSPSIHTFASQAPPDLRPRITTYHGDFLTVPFTERFDIIVACEVLEHVAEEAAFVGRMAALLAPGGMLIISVPAHMKFWSRHDELVGHLRRYERSDLERVAGWIPHDERRIVGYGYPWINLLRGVRILTSSVLLRQQTDQTTVERTIASGQLHPRLKWLNFVVNNVTLAPFAWVSTLFSDTDASDGYLLFLRKRRVEA